MIDHNVMRFHISVHNALAVAEIQGLQKLKDVIPDIEICEFGVEVPEIRIVHVLEDKGRCLAL